MNETKDIEEIVKQYEEIVADDFYQNKLATNWKQRKEWLIKKLTTLTQHHKAEVEKAVEERDKEWKKAIHVISPTEMHVNPDAIARLQAPTTPDKQ